MKLNVELTGVDKLLKRFDKYGEEATKKAASITKATAFVIAADAKRLAPKDTLELTKSIGVRKRTELSYAIFAAAKHAPYQEFGTGGLVEVPEALRDLAIKFKGKGVKKIDLKPQPYLWPALVINKENYKFRLGKELKKLAKQ